MRTIRLLLTPLALTLLAAGPVLAHIPLTPAILDDAFEEIADARENVRESRSRDARATAIYDFATEANNLMELLNQEIQLHGYEQQQLLDDAVARAAAQGINIIWSEDHERYFYAGEAFRRYLDLVPDGLDAANARFHLIETGFYLGDPGDREGLEDRIGMERGFLERYPEIGNAGRVVMFLAIDYRDLWRLCKAAGDDACVSRTADRLREHLGEAIARYGEARPGRLARSFLERFDAEAAGEP